MANIQTIQIDPSPAHIASMAKRGQFHSHQDGRWRFSPFGGDTVYVNDPTEHFPERAEFPNQRSAAVCPEFQLYACVFRDGTRLLDKWNGRNEFAFSAKDEGEKQQREWLRAAFAIKQEA